MKPGMDADVTGQLPTRRGSVVEQIKDANEVRVTVPFVVLDGKAEGLVEKSGDWTNRCSLRNGLMRSSQSCTTKSKGPLITVSLAFPWILTR